MGHVQTKSVAEVLFENEMLKKQVETTTASLRDQFAMATMQGLWGSPDMDGILRSTYNEPNGIKREQAMTGLAKIAYQQADAMLAARTK